ncbi:hypothetical protein EDD22DRAFT_843610 [Suillus occidentalis]|nr:hypothetical protein EDD22DRAFT_843610 [Suillus occidentalis]
MSPLQGSQADILLWPKMYDCILCVPDSVAFFSILGVGLTRMFYLACGHLPSAFILLNMISHTLYGQTLETCKISVRVFRRVTSSIELAVVELSIFILRSITIWYWERKFMALNTIACLTPIIVFFQEFILTMTRNIQRWQAMINQEGSGSPGFRITMDISFQTTRGQDLDRAQGDEISRLGFGFSEEAGERVFPSGREKCVWVESCRIFANNSDYILADAGKIPGKLVDKCRKKKISRAAFVYSERNSRLSDARGAVQPNTLARLPTKYQSQVGWTVHPDIMDMICTSRNDECVLVIKPSSEMINKRLLETEWMDLSVQARLRYWWNWDKVVDRPTGAGLVPRIRDTVQCH